jgi:hypothetical protein
MPAKGVDPHTEQSVFFYSPETRAKGIQNHIDKAKQHNPKGSVSQPYEIGLSRVP